MRFQRLIKRLLFSGFARTKRALHGCDRGVLSLALLSTSILCECTLRPFDLRVIRDQRQASSVSKRGKETLASCCAAEGFLEQTPSCRVRRSQSFEHDRLFCLYVP